MLWSRDHFVQVTTSLFHGLNVMLRERHPFLMATTTFVEGTMFFSRELSRSHESHDVATTKLSDEHVTHPVIKVNNADYVLGCFPIWRK